MDSKTRQQIEKAFVKVSRAAIRKKVYSLRAEQDGELQLARLFRAIAVSEEAQACRLLIQLRGQTGKNVQNCQAAFTEEIPDLISHYEEAAKIAENGGEKAMSSAFSQSARIQRKHLSLKKKLDKNSGLKNPYHVCGFCGFIMEGDAPTNCPICSAPASRFKRV
jgi:rubrerythrin